jgi:enoyl-CoA hydratase
MRAALRYCASTIRLPRQIPYTVAMDMLLLGEPISGQRAYDIGLVSHVTPHGGALARARELAELLAANGPLAVRNIKASVVENLEKTEAEAFRGSRNSAWW